jgi:heme-degrading monooxygenase HmoA
MVAHLTSMQCRRGCCTAFIRAYREHVLPVARSALGYRGLYLFADETSGRAFVLSLWDTAEDAAAFERHLATGEECAALDECLLEPTHAEVYEVSVQA